MSDLSTYEYAVAQKIEGAWRLKKFGMLFMYICFVIGWFIFGFASQMFPLLALIPITLYILVLATWRYVNVEYEYSMVSGTVTFSKIYGGKSRKKFSEFKIKDCSLIAPVSSHDFKANDYEPEAVYSALSGKNARDVYFALYEEKGKRTVFYFEATEKALKIFKYYNSSCTVVTKVSI